MGDVDLLVPPAAARAAQLCFDGWASMRRSSRGDLAGTRTTSPSRADRRTESPSASRSTVTPLSRDTLSSISMSNLTESPRPFDLNGTRALALGHVDTLRHLSHHLLEPSWVGRLRLIGLVDLLRYALTFHDRIDWRRLESSYPFVLNALRCLHHVIPLPAALARFSPPAGSPAPARVGETIRPLRAILAGRHLARRWESCSTLPTGGCTRITEFPRSDRSPPCGSVATRGVWRAGWACAPRASDCEARQGFHAKIRTKTRFSPRSQRPPALSSTGTEWLTRVA